MRHLSILDRIKEQAHDLTRQISGADKAKLDEYLTSVREVEKRIESLRDIKDKANVTLQKRPEALFTMERPENGLPEDIREHMRLMCDILALAFQTDKTRVATLLLCRDISGLFYPFWMPATLTTVHRITMSQTNLNELRVIISGRWHTWPSDWMPCPRAMEPCWITRV